MLSIVLLLFGENRSEIAIASLLRSSSKNNEFVFVNNGKRNKLDLFNKKIKISKGRACYLQNPRNLGFAGGCNVGIRQALKDGADSVFLLNQDAAIESGCLEALLKNPADIVAPVIRFKRAGRWVYDHGGKINWWLGRTNHIETKSQQPTAPSLDSLKYVSGCAMLIRRPVLEKIGLFDERFFLYFEDADFCQRAIKAGFKIAIEPKALVTHHLTEKEQKPFWQQVEMLKSNRKFIAKWLPLYRWPVAYFYWLVLSLRVVANNLLRRSSKYRT